MFLSSNNAAEVWQAGREVQVPAGTIAYHLKSQRTYWPGDRLKRADRKGALLVCRQQCPIQLRDLKVVLRRGQAAPCVHVVWCSLELAATDPAALASEVQPDRALRFADLEQRLAQELQNALRDVQVGAEEVDLRNPAAHARIQQRLREQLKVPGFRVAEVTLRRVLLESEYEEEGRVWLEFQQRLDGLLRDDLLARAARSSEVEKALAAIEEDRIRQLLTEREKTLRSWARLARYVELFGPAGHVSGGYPSQPCPHPHCRGDLSGQQTFVCSRCKNTLHAFHRSPAKPTFCDQCYSVVVRRRLVALATVAILLVGALLGGVGMWAANGPLFHRSARQEPPRPVEPLVLHWYGFGQRFEDNGWRQFQVLDGVTMYSGDQFRLVFSPSDDCFVYVVNIGPDGRVSQLFPNPAINLHNPCRRGQKYEIPDGINWFTLDEKTGVETNFLVASLEPLPDLESLLQKVSDGPGTSQSRREMEGWVRRVQEDTCPDASGKTTSHSVVRTRGVVIQRDRRLGPAQFEPPEHVEPVAQAIQGLGVAVQRIQVLHVSPIRRIRSHE